MYDIVILTDSRYINPKKRNWYINQVLKEDSILQKHLEDKGLIVCKKDWADKKFNWEHTKYAIFRTTWDYFEKFQKFLSWIEETKNKTTFINSVNIIKWNIDKHYLKDLQEKNINIAPTIFIEKNKTHTLKELLKQTKWKEVVIKPAISGAARHTYKINLNNHHEFENLFQELINNECMLFQEYLKNITLNGEISLIMIGGEYTHAVKKMAKKGDFRVQDDHGGIVEKYDANNTEIEFAKNVLKKCPYNPIYARIDIVYDNQDIPSLSELELIEPELWFRNNPNAAEKLAGQVLNLISSI